MKTLRIWYLAHFTDREVWRLNYDNEPRFTRLLSKKQAKLLANLFGGVAWIDYETMKKKL